MQDELNMSKEAFRDRFGDDPRKDDLTVLAPKQDDPTDQVTAFVAPSCLVWPEQSQVMPNSLCSASMSTSLRSLGASGCAILAMKCLGTNGSPHASCERLHRRLKA